jgi:suppressor of fused protein SUFU
MIPIQCDGCGKKYHAQDRHAGRRLRCKICGQALRVPEPLDALPEESEQIIRHEARTKQFQPAAGDSACIEAITNHIETHIGPVAFVFHELVSDLVHIDIHQVHPTDDRPFYTLVTSGMSDRPMTVPEEAEGCSQFAELMLCLPADWKLSEKAFEDERWYWPVRWLKMLARLPHEYDTWLGFGHTIPNGDPPKPFAANTKLCCNLILPPVTVPEEFRLLTIDDEKTIEFFSIVPLYSEEVNFKLKHGADPLANRLREFEVTELLDIRRANVCGRR